MSCLDAAPGRAPGFRGHLRASLRRFAGAASPSFISAGARRERAWRGSSHAVSMATEHRGDALGAPSLSRCASEAAFASRRARGCRGGGGQPGPSWHRAACATLARAPCLLRLACSAALLPRPSARSLPALPSLHVAPRERSADHRRIAAVRSPDRPQARSRAPLCLSALLRWRRTAGSESKRSCTRSGPSRRRRAVTAPWCAAPQRCTPKPRRRGGSRPAALARKKAVPSAKTGSRARRPCGCVPCPPRAASALSCASSSLCGFAAASLLLCTLPALVLQILPCPAAAERWPRQHQRRLRDGVRSRRSRRLLLTKPRHTSHAGGRVGRADAGVCATGAWLSRALETGARRASAACVLVLRAPLLAIDAGGGRGRAAAGRLSS